MNVYTTFQIDEKCTLSLNKSQNEVVNRSLHESLETCNVNEASKCNTTLDHIEEVVNEDFADLTITEKDILEVIGEEVEEDITTREEQKERKVSIPSSNIVAKANMAQVKLIFFI